VIDFTDGGNSQAFTGSGWSLPEPGGRWTEDTNAEMQISGLDRDTDYICEMAVLPFVAPPALPAQSVHLSCNGTPLCSAEFSERGPISFHVPRAAISLSGELHLTLRLPCATIPYDLGVSTDGRRLGICLWRMTFEPRPMPAEFQRLPAASPAIPAAATPAAPSTEKRPLAVVTSVYNDVDFLPVWLRHYAAQVGIENCYVIDQGSNDGSTDDLKGCNVIRIPRLATEPATQSTYLSKFCSSLLCWYRRVLLAGVDEIVLADPLVAPTLAGYVPNGAPDVLTVIGLNVVHRPDHEADLDLGNLITAQRSYVFASSYACRPRLISRDVRWTAEGHSADAALVFGDLYSFNLGWCDRRLGLRRTTGARSADVFDTQLRGFAALPAIEHCGFSRGTAPVAPFVEAVERSQVGREFDAQKIDLRIWSSKLWRLPPRFVGMF
jgi:hypothetical protein